jgi:creatinine amidohydrolase
MRNRRSVAESAGPLLILVLGITAPAAAQVHRVAALNTEQIRTLDRSRTVVILPGSILEQHGPYLPSYTDGYRNERLAQALAEAVAARPGWAALVFPSIPLGTGGANEIGRQYVFPGTYAIRSRTLRSVFMDLAGELGEQGFRWIFIVHGHGAPNHNRMLDQAGDYFHDTYGGWMVHLRGLLPVATAGDSALDAAAREKDGFSVHAGAAETSEMLFLRSDLVPTSLRQAESRAGTDWPALVRIARESSWPGYFGSPSVATAAQGARINRAATDAAVAYALKILDGMDPREIPRFADAAADSPENVAIDADALRREMDMLRKQEDWLTRKKLR